MSPVINLTRLELPPSVSLRSAAAMLETETRRPLLRVKVGATRSTCPPSSGRSLRPDSSRSGRRGTDKHWPSASVTMVTQQQTSLCWCVVHTHHTHVTSLQLAALKWVKKWCGQNVCMTVLSFWFKNKTKQKYIRQHLVIRNWQFLKTWKGFKVNDLNIWHEEYLGYQTRKKMTSCIEGFLQMEELLSSRWGHRMFTIHDDTHTSRVWAGAPFLPSSSRVPFDCCVLQYLWHWVCSRRAGGITCAGTDMWLYTLFMGMTQKHMMSYLLPEILCNLQHS